MKRSKTVTVGELLDEFFQRPYVAAKVAEGRLRDTWREIVGPAADAETTELRLENHILHVRIRSSILRNELFYQREALGAAATKKKDEFHRMMTALTSRIFERRLISAPKASRW